MGGRAEMAHVRVQRLGAGDAQEYAAEHQKTGGTPGEQVLDAVPRIERPEHRRMLRNTPDAERADHHEPERHDRPERLADPRRALRLKREQPDQHCHGRRQYVSVEGGRDHLQTLERRQHGDRRRDGAVAVDQGGAEQADRDDDGAAGGP